MVKVHDAYEARRIPGPTIRFGKNRLNVGILFFILHVLDSRAMSCIFLRTPGLSASTLVWYHPDQNMDEGIRIDSP
jgi:hypothetical protein